MINFILVTKDDRQLTWFEKSISAPVVNALTSKGERCIISKVKTPSRASHKELLTTIEQQLGDFYSAFSGTIIFCDSDYYEYLRKYLGLFLWYLAYHQLQN